jgi:uncharacterized Fe-S cluster protein YjdI
MVVIALMSIGILIYWLLSKKEYSGDAGDWSDDQKADVKEYMKNSVIYKYNTVMCDKTFDCLINLYSKNHSVDAVKQPFFFPTPAEMLEIKNCFNLCLGELGHWDDSFKEVIRKGILSKSKQATMGCVNCLISALEKKYEPAWFMNKDIKKEDIENIIMSCVSSGLCKDDEIKI